MVSSGSPPVPATKKPAESLAVYMRDLLLCSLSIYTCYMIYGLVHERIYKTPRGEDGEKYSYTFTLLLMQCFVNSLVALLAQMIKGSKEVNQVPATDYLSIGVTYIGAMFASNYALFYVSYPTQVLGKSCKLIPVMLMNVVWYKKKYGWREYAAVGTITIGICVFQLAAGKTGGTDSWFGIGLLFLSLFLDGFTGPTQDNIRAKYKPDKDTMMMWMNFYACILLIIALGFSQEYIGALQFILKFPEILLEIAVFCLLSALGQYAILVTLFRFDSLVLTTVTTTRKFFSILASVVMYGHALSFQQWTGVAIVFTGLGIDMWSKQMKKKTKLQVAAKLTA